MRKVAITREASSLQWRDRAGFIPASLLPPMGTSNSNRPAHTIQARALSSATATTVENRFVKKAAYGQAARITAATIAALNSNPRAWILADCFSTLFAIFVSPVFILTLASLLLNQAEKTVRVGSLATLLCAIIWVRDLHEEREATTISATHAWIVRCFCFAPWFVAGLSN